jgi:hypothetical protein
LVPPGVENRRTKAAVLRFPNRLGRRNSDRADRAEFAVDKNTPACAHDSCAAGDGKPPSASDLSVWQSAFCGKISIYFIKYLPSMLENRAIFRALSCAIARATAFLTQKSGWDALQSQSRARVSCADQRVCGVRVLRREQRRGNPACFLSALVFPSSRF